MYKVNSLDIKSNETNHLENIYKIVTDFLILITICQIGILIISLCELFSVKDTIVCRKNENMSEKEAR